jgi:CheY-like chemotaxis protein
MIGENIELIWSPGASLWPVKVDPGQMDQVLANLCANARDAIAAVGKITIETKNTTFSETDCAEYAGSVPGDYVMLAVSDNGCGMNQEVLDNIFEPFFTTKDVGQGTGLGLASVYGVVKQNNGFISVDSGSNRGTTFRIYFPRHAGADSQTSEEDAVKKPVRSGHETVLLVDDDLEILNLAKQTLEALGYKVWAAATPGEAIRLAEEQAGNIDLLLTDMVMPEMNGGDLAKKLQLLCPGLKMLFMSGYAANVLASHGILEEGVRFIQKPYTLNELASRVRAVLEGR